MCCSFLDHRHGLSHNACDYNCISITVYQKLSCVKKQINLYPTIPKVPDPKISVLAEINSSVKSVPTTLEFVDVAGLVKGASAGEGLGNQFLATIRQCDAIVHVVSKMRMSSMSMVLSTPYMMQNLLISSWHLRIWHLLKNVWRGLRRK